jgi:hypothetical protein
MKLKLLRHDYLEIVLKLSLHISINRLFYTVEHVYQIRIPSTLQFELSDQNLDFDI